MLNYKSLNQVTIVGRIGAFQVKSANNGNKFLTGSVVTESSVKGEDGKWTKKEEWHNITLFGSTAEKIGNFLVKGSIVMVTGSLSYRKGEKGTFCNIVADQFQIISQPSQKEKFETTPPKQNTTPPTEPVEEEMF